MNKPKFSVYFPFLVLSLNSCLFYSTVYALEERGSIFKNLTTENGFATQFINCINQDESGYIWIGSSNGLNLFDGTSNQVFTHNSGVSSSLSDDYVTTIFVDSRGNVWVGTRYGLNLYDKVNHRFYSFTHHSNDLRSISDNEVWSLAQDRRGNIWVGTLNGGLCKVLTYNINGCTKYSFVNYRSDSSDSHSLSNNAVRAIYFDPFGYGWIGTQVGLNRFYVDSSETDHIRFSRYRHDNKDQASIASNFISSIVSDPDTNMWLIGGEGLLDMITKSSIQNNTGLDAQHFISIFSGWVEQASIISTLFFDKSGNCWIGTLENGLFRVGFNDLCTKHIDSNNSIHFSNLDKDPNSLLDNSIRSLYEDKEGNVWIGTGSGISILPPYFNQFQAIKNLNEWYPYIPQITTFNLKPNDDGFFSTADDSVYYFKNDEITPVRFSRKYSEDLSVKSILYMSDRIWVGTETQGLLYFKITKLNRYIYASVIREVTSKLRPPFKISWDNINKLIKCRDGNILVASMGGLDIINPKNFIVKNLLNYKDFRGSHTEGLIRSVIQDSEGEIWAGSDDGLYRFSSYDKKPVVYRGNLSKPSELPSDRISALLEGRNGSIWIGTSSGLSVYDPAADSFRTFTIDDGLPSNNIMSLIKDQTGNIWVGTDHGLSCYSVSSQSFRNYFKDDGLNANELRPEGLCMNSQGLIYVLTIKGMNCFYPNQLFTDSVPAVPLLTDFKIQGESIRTGAFKSLDSIFNLSKRLVLKYDQNFFSVDYNAISFVHSDRDQFSYFLTNLDKRWSNPGILRTANYTNVPPGDYIFNLKVTNCDGIPGVQSISLPIEVMSPWWGTWWFKAVVFFSFLSLIIIVTRFLAQVRLRQKLLILQKQKALESERRRISVDLHDDIGSALNSISLYSEIAKQKAQNQFPSVTPYFEKIGEDSRAIIENMSDIVWMINPRNDSMETLLQRMENFAAQLLGPRGISFQFNNNEKVRRMKPPIEARRNLYLIFKEAINNCVKYSECTEVIVRFYDEEGKLNMIISDNGKGFDVSKNYTGNGLHHFKVRAKEMGGTIEIRSSAGKGTTIHLQFKST